MCSAFDCGDDKDCRVFVHVTTCVRQRDNEADRQREGD